MNQSKKFTEKAIEDMILEIAGKDGLSVYNILKNKQNVNEFDIANKLKLTINQIRNLIYKFEQYNLVTSIRKKDRKKGWYIYFFTFNEKEAEKSSIILKKNKIEQLKKKLNRESSHEFYACPNKCIRITIENAIENNFTCMECNNLLQPEEREKNTIKIAKEIKVIEEELNKLKP